MDVCKNTGIGKATAKEESAKAAGLMKEGLALSKQAGSLAEDKKKLRDAWREACSDRDKLQQQLQVAKEAHTTTQQQLAAAVEATRQGRSELDRLSSGSKSTQERLQGADALVAKEQRKRETVEIELAEARREILEAGKANTAQQQVRSLFRVPALDSCFPGLGCSLAGAEP